MADVMYRRILVPLDTSFADAAILEHVRDLVKKTGGAVVLIHVADGWVARNIQQLDLRESEEMKDDFAYLDRIGADLRHEGLTVEAILAAGDPAKEIAAAAEREQCDLIAMATHGHKLLQDVVRGSVASELRHITMVPILMVRARKP